MQDAGWPWDLLGIGPTEDERAVKRAYATRLKLTRPDEDAEGFQRLRDAYHAARHFIQAGAGRPTGRLVPTIPAEQALDAEPAAQADPGSAPALRMRPEPRPQSPDPQPDQELPIRPELQALSHDAGPEAWTPVGPGPGQELPEQLAYALWQRFLVDAPFHPRAGLSALENEPALLNFAVREALELVAAQHAAAADCSDMLRDAIVEHFGWEDDHAHLASRDAVFAFHAVGRYRAAQSYKHFQHQATRGANHAISRLLADSIPQNLGRIHDAGFVRSMKDLLAHIRWQHPEMLHYRLNAEVFAWWEDRIARKKYFVQTGFYSAAAGAVLFAAANAARDPNGLFGHEYMTGALFFLCQLLAFGVVGWVVLRPPRQLLDAWAGFKEQRIDRLVHQHRHENAWQYGWILPFTGLSLLMLIPRPDPVLRYFVTGGQLLCALAAVFAGSVALKWTRFALIAMLSALVALVMGGTRFMEYGYAPCLCLCVCLYTLALQDGAPMYARAGWSPARINWLRAGWLATALAVCLAGGAIPDAALAALLLLCCIAGIVLGRFVTAGGLCWGFLIACAIPNPAVKYLTPSSGEPHIGILFATLMATACFVIANLLNQAATKPHL